MPERENEVLVSVVFRAASGGLPEGDTARLGARGIALTSEKKAGTVVAYTAHRTVGEKTPIAAVNEVMGDLLGTVSASIVVIQVYGRLVEYGKVGER